MVKCVIHPTYFPSVSQFHLLLKNPCVMEISDNYQKQTYRNRTYIYGANGKQLLSVPIQHTKGNNGRQLYKDVKIDNSYPWQKNHWKSLKTAYQTTPYFEFYEDVFEQVFSEKFNFLLDLNFKTIEAILFCLSVDIQWEKTSQYQEKYVDFQDFRFLTDAKKEWEIQQEEYYQIFQQKHGFLPNLSILDLLFHEGNRSVFYLENSIKINV